MLRFNYTGSGLTRRLLLATLTSTRQKKRQQHRLFSSSSSHRHDGGPVLFPETERLVQLRRDPAVSEAQFRKRAVAVINEHGAETNCSPQLLELLLDLRSSLIQSKRASAPGSAANQGRQREQETDAANLKSLVRQYFSDGSLELRLLHWGPDIDRPLIARARAATVAVHPIASDQALRRRFCARGHGKRCFMLVHPLLPDRPLVFIEAALGNWLAQRIEPLVEEADDDTGFVNERDPTHAIFYAIVSAEPGVAGLDLGRALIYRVADALKREFPNSLRVLSTLSPVPSFRKHVKVHEPALFAAATAAASSDSQLAAVQPDLVRACTELVCAKPSKDPVAAFHLGNGARVESVNWLADKRDLGWQKSFGIMVNYLYNNDAAVIEQRRAQFNDPDEPIPINK